MTKIVKIADTQKPEKKVIKEICDFLKKGGIIAYPTETCYGLGADAFNEGAVERIISLKRREAGKPIAVISGNRETAINAFKIKSGVILKLVENFWPGPLTIVAESSINFAKGIMSKDGMVGIRVSENSFARAIADEIGGFLTATSANFSLEKECRSAEEVIEAFKDKIEIVIDGGKSQSKGLSTVIEIRKDGYKILREGLISQNEIEKIIK